MHDYTSFIGNQYKWYDLELFCCAFVFLYFYYYYFQSKIPQKKKRKYNFFKVIVSQLRNKKLTVVTQLSKPE